ncbi:HpcH/HpaI aldolase/citrate lyase family protein [Sedimenticola selenatireducens]|uniref:CoA ester lyase n=1 Tax=Sedimenticola selenatireducens TaxID=191960 RepID=A0A2N6CTW2_9GAMM|nr:CoA ester lyase [Sedimenticola selenatireducens]PLX60613.1 MAG: CoA ester lyase [Sedimenticola selenatireducens]
MSPRSYSPLRSVLYAPGANSRALDKARSLPVDGLILDLEDAVAPAAKAAARDAVVAALSEGGFGYRRRIVRVNGLDTPWGEADIAAMARTGADAILLPKVESPQAVQTAVAALDAAGGPADLPIWIMAETPRGILQIDSIAAAHPRLQVIVMGTSDLAKELRVRHTPGREGLLASLGLCVLAARARGLEILDGVYLYLRDEPGFAAACEQGRDMGFDGKTLIHPRQIEPANRIFGISAEALQQAQQIIAAWREAQQAGSGVCVVDGRLVENLHVEEAERLVTMHEVIRGRN